VSVRTIVRPGRPEELEIVGCDLSEARADAEVSWGLAEWGPSIDVPPALYLLEELDLRGLRYPAGSRLTVGFEISEAEALLLMRGTDRHLVSVPPGGSG
jgi:hypothetical protein